MGAGSTPMHEKLHPMAAGKENTKPCKTFCFFRHTVKEIGVQHFLNTKEPYLIEECSECKCQYLRELPHGTLTYNY